MAAFGGETVGGSGMTGVGTVGEDALGCQDGATDSSRHRH
jgi:hypothetical protein